MRGILRARHRVSIFGLTLSYVDDSLDHTETGSPDLPRELERIVQRCLRKDPVKRFQVMADLVVELDEVKTESGEWANDPSMKGVIGPQRENRATPGRGDRCGRSPRWPPC